LNLILTDQQRASSMRLIRVCVICRFELTNLFEPNSVPAAFKLRGKPYRHYRHTRPLPEQIAGKTENVRIIMLPA